MQEWREVVAEVEDEGMDERLLIASAGCKASGNLLLTAAHGSLSYKMLQEVLQSLHSGRKQGKPLFPLPC